MSGALDIACPKCGAMNKPGRATPTIELDVARGEAACNECGHGWKVKRA